MGPCHHSILQELCFALTEQQVYVYKTKLFFPVSALLINKVKQIFLKPICPLCLWLEILIQVKKQNLLMSTENHHHAEISLYKNPVAHNHLLIESQQWLFAVNPIPLLRKFCDISRSESLAKCVFIVDPLCFSEFVWNIEECYPECVGFFLCKL